MYESLLIYNDSRILIPPIKQTPPVSVPPHSACILLDPTKQCTPLPTLLKHSRIIHLVFHPIWLHHLAFSTKHSFTQGEVTILDRHQSLIGRACGVEGLATWMCAWVPVPSHDWLMRGCTFFPHCFQSHFYHSQFISHRNI